MTDEQIIGTINRALADNRTSIRGHIHDTAPGPHQAQTTERREQFTGRRNNMLWSWIVATLGIGIIKINIAAKHHFTFVRL